MKQGIRIRSFEGLRFLFAITIFLNHCTFLTNTTQGEWIFEHFFHNGAFGVTFYFVLSGFCLFLGYGEKFVIIEYQEYIRFVIRRIKKIYPLYLITMFWAFLYETMTGAGIVGGILQLVLSGTMIQSLSFKYWGILNSAAWFVSCIFICYLFVPFIFCFLHKIEKSKLLYVCMSGCVAVICLAELGSQWLVTQGYLDSNTGMLLTYTYPLYRIFYVAVGMLMAKIFMSNREKQVKHAGTMELLAVAAVCVAYFLGINGGTIENYRGVYYLLVVMLMIFVFAFEQGKISSFFKRPTWVKLGKYSLEIYLIHFVVINFGGREVLDIFMGNSNVWLLIKALVLFIITLILAYIMKKVTDRINVLIDNGLRKVNLL